MRTIKFRVWSSFFQTMFYDYPIKKEDLGINLNNIFEDQDVIFLQYTGLKDKNGKEIYDGDIIKKYGVKVNLEIAFSAPWFRAITRMKDGQECGAYYFDDAEEVEVIGNIYEKPELLIN